MLQTKARQEYSPRKAPLLTPVARGEGKDALENQGRAKGDGSQSINASDSGRIDDPCMDDNGLTLTVLARGGYHAGLVNPKTPFPPGERAMLPALPLLRKRLTAFRLMACTLSIGLVWIILEIPAALNWINWRILLDKWSGLEVINYQYKTGFVLDREMEFRRTPYAQWSGVAAGDIEAEWSIPPAQPRWLTFSYDQWGYRNPAGMDRANVVFLGDSFVDGWYVNDPETSVRILEKELGQPIANLGVAGYGPKQELMVLRKQALRLRPSVVVWFFFEGNDIYDDFRTERWLDSPDTNPAGPNTTGRPLIPSQTWRERSWTFNLIRLIRAWGHPWLSNRIPYAGQLQLPGCKPLPVYFAPYASIPWSDWLAERWTKMQPSFTEGARFCQENGIRLLVCYVPIKFRVYRSFMTFAPNSPCLKWTLWNLPADFANFCAAANIPFLDLTGPLQEALRQGVMPYAKADSHWSPEGHRLVARLVGEEIRRREWLTHWP